MKYNKLQLCRENDLLREQLKRYVGIVKQHKEDDEQKDEQKDMAAKLSGVSIHVLHVL